jgi:predicted enzyme related to lactoylglutathione lyase
MNNVAYFEIQASNPKDLQAFYAAIFKWKFTKEEKLPIEYYRIEKAGINGGLLKRPANMPPPGYGTNAFTCSVMVEDFDSIEKLILASGGQIALPKFAVPGVCWQGYFIDPDGNTFGLFQPDENAK